MPLPLESQWRLEYPGVDLILGSSPASPPRDQRGFHHMKAPSIGDPGLQLEDADKPRADGINFGEDFRSGRLITFELGLKGDSNDDVLALYADLLGAWRGDGVRGVPGSVATLSTSHGGRLRAVYGRPRRVQADHTVPRSALMLGTADFQTVDDLFYDPVINSIVVPIIPAVAGGMVGPLSAPLSVSAPTVQFGVITVSGNKPAWPIITIHGPIANPSVELINEWKLQLNMSIGVGVDITIDTRPWAGSVTSGAGVSFAGKLSKSSWLERSFLNPGSHTLSLKGSDATGTSNMTVAWYDTYVSI